MTLTTESKCKTGAIKINFIEFIRILLSFKQSKVIVVMCETIMPKNLHLEKQA